MYFLRSKDFESFGLNRLLNSTISYTCLGSALPDALGSTAVLIIAGIFEISRLFHLEKDGSIYLSF